MWIEPCGFRMDVAIADADVAASVALMASWRSGYAEDCKSLYGGSIPSEASRFASCLWTMADVWHLVSVSYR